jgi:cytolysin-activating lysine-acyltransferase
MADTSQSQPGQIKSGQGPEAKKTVAQVLGEVTWLLTQSPVHKQLFIGDLEWFVMPAVLLEQFRIFNGPQHPVAFALWARVSEETEQRLEAGAHKLRPDEWKGGDRAWLIEVVAPFGGHDEILADMSKNIFAGETFKYHSVNDAGQRVVLEHSPDVAPQTTN